MQIIVKDNIDEVVKELGRDQKQVGYAASRAINKALPRATKALTWNTLYAFKNPTPYFAKGFAYDKSHKTKLVGRVKFKDKRRALYFRAQTKQSQRLIKPFEKKLVASRLLPRGYKVVPATGASRDVYGNPKRGQMVRIFEAVKTKQGAYFAVVKKDDDLPMGIWKRPRRKDGSPLPVFLYVKVGRYSKRIDLRKVAEEEVMHNFPRLFAQYYEDALRTAKR